MWGAAGVIEKAKIASDSISAFDAGRRLRLDAYQDFVLASDKTPVAGEAGLRFVLMGLFGETGSFLSEVKKKLRDTDTYESYRDSVIEEFGDVLWYFTTACLRGKLNLSAVAKRAAHDADGWRYHGKRSATIFGNLQKQKKHFRPRANQEVEGPLLALAAEVGALLQEFANKKVQRNQDALAARLVEIFRALVAAADHVDISIGEAAIKNMRKSEDRWPQRRTWGEHFDASSVKTEQLPRIITVKFEERVVAGKTYVYQTCNGINIGDRLTDNRHPPDDYRFHDVFHLAYAAILGWSPVLRALFKVKRKSDAKLDENEDGARAILIEEGVSTWVFNHGVRNKQYRQAKSLDYSLLKAVRELVKGYEVERRPLWQWQEAILEGFRVFRLLKQNRKGVVVADLNARKITYRKS